MTLPRAIAVLAVLAALAGCTISNTGKPKPVAATPSTENPLPPRPRELDLTGVDPCTDLLTRQQLIELDYDLGYFREPLPDHSDIHGGPDCTFGSTGLSDDVDRNMSALVAIATTEGADVYMTDPARKPDKPPEIVRIEGFAALVLPHPHFVDECLVVVDTAAGQYLEVSVAPSNTPRTSVEPSCEEAERVAGMAIQTVSAAG